MDNRLVLSVLFVTLSWRVMGAYAQNATNATATTMTGGSTTPATIVSPTNTTSPVANGGATMGAGNTTANGGTMTTAGNTTANGGTMTTAGNTMANGGATMGAGNTTANGGTMTTAGNTTANGGTMTTAGNTTANGGTMTTAGNTTANGGTMTTAGNMTANGGTMTTTGNTTANGGTMTTAGNTTANGGTTIGAGNVTNTTAASTVSSTTTPATTSAIPVANLQTPVSRTNCGTSKLCAAQPSTCNPTTGVGCTFISAQQQSGQLYDFELSAESDGYIAAGVSTSSNVNGTQQAYICANNNGVVRFFTGNISNLVLSLTQSNASNVKGAINSRKIQCTFAATLPDTTVRAADYSLAVSNGTYNPSTGTFGQPKFLLFTNRVNLSDPTSNTTNQISGAYSATYQQSLISALLVTVVMLTFSSL